LLEPRAVRPDREDNYGAEGGGYDDRDDRDAGGYQERAPRERDSRPPRANRDAPAAGGNDKASRKLERLISLLVEKGVIAPGEIDGLAQAAAAGAPANA
jgi:hypothetical protein